VSDKQRNKELLNVGPENMLVYKIKGSLNMPGKKL